MSDNSADTLSQNQQWALTTALKYLAKAASEGLLEDCVVPLSSMYPRLLEASRGSNRHSYSARIPSPESLKEAIKAVNTTSDTSN